MLCIRATGERDSPVAEPELRVSSRRHSLAPIHVPRSMPRRRGSSPFLPAPIAPETISARLGSPSTAVPAGDFWPSRTLNLCNGCIRFPPKGAPEVPGQGSAEPSPVGLRYVTDLTRGISRVRRGKNFTYRGPDGRTIRDPATLRRLASLAIPPAWTNVWIACSPAAHLQATGRDAHGRKQYRYHDRWRAARDETKFAHMLDFGKALPRIRERVAHDLNRHGLPRDKILASVVRLMERTLARIGNPEYARENQSFGLTTL